MKMYTLGVHLTCTPYSKQINTMRFLTFIYLIILIVTTLTMFIVKDTVTYIFIYEYEQYKLEDLLEGLIEDEFVIPKNKGEYDL